MPEDPHFTTPFHFDHKGSQVLHIVFSIFSKMEPLSRHHYDRENNVCVPILLGGPFPAETPSYFEEQGGEDSWLLRVWWYVRNVQIILENRRDPATPSLCHP